MLTELDQGHKFDSRLLLEVIADMAQVRLLRESTGWLESSGLSGEITKTSEMGNRDYRVLGIAQWTLQGLSGSIGGGTFDGLLIGQAISQLCRDRN